VKRVWAMCLLLSLATLALPPSARAQPPSKPLLRLFLQGVVERRLQMDLAAALESRGFRPEQIREVFESPEYFRLAERVTGDPQLLRAMDRYLERALDPKVLQATMERRRQDIAASRSLALALFLRQALAEKEIHQRSAEPPRKPFWDRLWETITAYLLGDAL
jgi:hypothetical protein